MGIFWLGFIGGSISTVLVLFVLCSLICGSDD